MSERIEKIFGLAIFIFFCTVYFLTETSAIQQNNLFSRRVRENEVVFREGGFRFEARAGQGAETASHILQKALFLENHWSVSTPEYGPAQSGSPMRVHIRTANQQIIDRSYVEEPDWLIIFSGSLLEELGENLFSGLKSNGILLLNTGYREDIGYLNLLPPPSEEQKFYYIPARDIASEVIGTERGENVVMLGALVRVTKLIKLSSLLEAIRSHLSEKLKLPPAVVEKNVQAARRGYEEVRVYSKP
ncbi:MAG: 2-oxoacid:acceptor oxidoreductase family protein [Candidatus Omnitrophica bacterium]|nr:2-oxoacid:acceptor oxidoreductase family protein [Candidatus Omnitrophota bacterium]